MADVPPEEPSTRAPPRSRARLPWLAVIVACAAFAATLAPFSAPAIGGGSPAVIARAASAPAIGIGIDIGIDAPPACPAPARPPRYPDVQPIFEQHCATCHDARQAKNDAAQAVFEMSSYPFSTRRPATLLDDLRAMLPKRGALSAEEKCRGLQWLTAGALDADGNLPRWR